MLASLCLVCMQWVNIRKSKQRAATCAQGAAGEKEEGLAVLKAANRGLCFSPEFRHICFFFDVLQPDGGHLNGSLWMIYARLVIWSESVRFAILFFILIWSDISSKFNCIKSSHNYNAVSRELNSVILSAKASVCELDWK